MTNDFISSTGSGMNSESSSPVRAINRPFSESVLFPVLTPERLLFSTQRKKILEEMQALSEAPPAYYEALYDELIKNFVEFVQALPVTNDARLCSLMDEGLLRGLFLLQLQKTFAEPLEPVMVYAFFSAALLFDVGNVLEDRVVVISDPEGGYVSEWSPFAGPMLPDDGQYKIHRGEGMPSWVCRRIVPFLARQIMPPAGFDWIASDPLVLNTWLAILSGDKEGAGALAFSFWRIFETLEEFKKRQEWMLFELDEIERAKEAEATKLAEEFMAWLKNGLKSGKITVNKPTSHVHKIKVGKKKLSVVKAGAAKAFGKGKPSAVIKQLKKIGVLGKAGKYKKAGKAGGKYGLFYGKEGMPANSAFLGFLISDYGNKLLAKRLAPHTAEDASHAHGAHIDHAEHKNHTPHKAHVVHDDHKPHVKHDDHKPHAKHVEHPKHADHKEPKADGYPQLPEKPVERVSPSPSH